MVTQGESSRAIHLYPVLVIAGDSTTVPDLSHFVGWVPRWFWMNTLSPMVRGQRGLKWVVRDSVVQASLVRRASSLAAHAWRQRGLMWGLENFSSWLTKDSVSRRGRPKIICAGERLQSGSGMFRSCSMAHRKRS